LEQLLVTWLDDFAQFFLVEFGHINVLSSDSEVGGAREKVVEVVRSLSQISVLVLRVQLLIDLLQELLILLSPDERLGDKVDVELQNAHGGVEIVGGHAVLEKFAGQIKICISEFFL